MMSSLGALTDFPSLDPPRLDPTMSLFRAFAALLLSLAVHCVTAAEPPKNSALASSDDAMIRELETASWVAWKNHDGGFFEKFLSDDHVEVHSYGIVGKAAVVQGVRSSACTVQSYALGPFSMTPVSSDTVLVTYRAEQTTYCGDARVPSPVWATSLYARRAGQWVNVLYQHTPLPRS